MEFLKNPNSEFLGTTRYFVAASALLIVGGIGWMVQPGGLRYGVEFSGGTQLVVKFEKTPEVDKIRSAVEAAAPGAVIQSYDEPSKNQVLIRIAAVGEGGELGALAEKALQALREGYTGNPLKEHSAEIVGPVVGAELQRKAIQLTVLGLLFQLIYIGIRFGGAVW